MTTRSPRPSPRPEGRPPMKKRWWAAIFGGVGFWVSVGLHLVVGVVATYIVVQQFQKRHVNFQATAPPAPNPPVEHKVQLAKKNNVESAPPDIKRITTTDVSPITLPDVPDTPKADEDSPSMMSGEAGTMGGSGTGGGGGDGGAGAASPVFGALAGNGLEGHLFDFTKDKRGDATEILKHSARKTTFEPIIRGFVEHGFAPNNPCAETRKPLYTKHLLVPVTRDENAGAAFGSPESSHAYWLVHYSGNISVVSVKSTSNFRFLGFGDNVLIVAINGKVVLEGSDMQYLARSAEQTHVGNVNMPGAGGSNKPLWAGNYVHLEPGTNYKIDIVIGDEGGVTTSGLFVQAEHTDLTFAPNGIPKVPFFTLDNLNDADKKVLSEYLPPECFAQDLVVTSVAAAPPDPFAPDNGQ